MRFIIFISVILLVGCGPKKQEIKTIELRPDTYLKIYITFHKGLLESSISHSLAVLWPNKRSPDNIGSASFYNGTEDVRLLEKGGQYVLVYGDWLYYRSDSERKWKRSKIVNSVVSPPSDSVAQYLRTWFDENNKTNYSFVPYRERISPQVETQYEQITWTDESGRDVATLNHRSQWLVAYRLAAVDVQENRVTYQTEEIGIPSVLVFQGAKGYFGGWMFSSKVTRTQNEKLKQHNSTAPISTPSDP